MFRKTVEEIREKIAATRKVGIYAIKDKNANEYNVPFFQPTQQHAVRVFRTEVNRANEQNLLYLYPEEFELHYLGTFDQEKGSIDHENQFIVSGHQLKNNGSAA